MIQIFCCCEGYVTCCWGSVKVTTDKEGNYTKGELFPKVQNKDRNPPSTKQKNTFSSKETISKKKRTTKVFWGGARI